MKVLYSVILDWQEKYFVQVGVFLRTILAAGISPEHVVIQATGRAMGQAEILGAMFKVRVVKIDPYIDTQYCNKIQELIWLSHADCDVGIMYDADVAFADSPAGCAVMGKIRVRPIDRDQTPIPVIERLARAIRFKKEPPCLWDITCDTTKTWYGNLNGGVYVLPRDVMSDLYEKWSHYSRMIYGSVDILGGKTLFAEQLGFCFASIDMGLDLDIMPVEYAFPSIGFLHVTKQGYGVPKVMHHHGLDEKGLIPEHTDPILNEAITKVNRLLQGKSREDD